MNILVLNNSSDLYGSNKILIYVLRAMIKAGHHPIVVLSEPGPVEAELEKLRVEVRFIRLGIFRRKYFNVPGLLNRLSAMRKAWTALSKIISDENIELIYSNTTGVLIGGLLARKKKIRHIWHVHEIITSPAVFTRAIGFCLNKLSDKIIVVSDAVKSHWAKFADPAKITRIYNGIDTAPFELSYKTVREELDIPAEAVIIGMIGRVNHWKGQQYYIAIAIEILKTHPDVKFLLAGDAFPGNEHLVEELESEIIRRRLLDSVLNLGFREDTPALMNSFDIFVSPSILPDPFPTVILEAMAASKPVIATAHGGAVEMLSGQTGILIPVNDPAAAAQMIIPLIQSAEMRQVMGAQGNRRIKANFSNEAFEAAITAVL